MKSSNHLTKSRAKQLRANHPYTQEIIIGCATCGRMTCTFQNIYCCSICKSIAETYITDRDLFSFYRSLEIGIKVANVFRNHEMSNLPGGTK